MEPSTPQFDPKARVSNELAVRQPGEEHICTVKRHPIGIIGVYAGVAVVLTAVAVLAFGVAPSASANNSGEIMTIGAVIFVILAALAFIYALIATVVYWGNSWVITSDSVTQVSQTGLFRRQSSQLSLGNLEDVTAVQNGILAHLFNYGVLKAETAGERSKFSFPFCPNPNLYAQQILQARENFMQTHPEG
jgi:uncharacterized membrane protein YdbT with pleckstrin-like domain